MLSGLKWLSPFFVTNFCSLSILGSIAAVVGIASGINSLTGGGGGSSGGTTAGGTVYDPFSSYRGTFGSTLANMMLGAPQVSSSSPFQTQYGQMAGNMMMPGASFTSSDPSYNFRFQSGLDAVNRTEAAKGMLGSGNRLMDLMNYGQGMASTEFGNEFSRLTTLEQLGGSNFGSQFNRLASLAGVNQAMPSGYGQLQAQNQQSGWNALAQGLGGLSGGGGGIGNYMGFDMGTGGSGYNIGGEQGAMLASQW